MNFWSILVFAGTLVGLQTPPSQIPDRLILNATFRGAEIGLDFVRLECYRDSKELGSSRCSLDEVLLMGCDSGTARLFARHTSNDGLKVSGNLLKRQISAEIEGAGVRTVFRFDYFPAANGTSAYILTDAIMTMHDSVKKLDYEFQALKGRDTTITLPCAIRANGLWDRKELP